MPTPQPTSSASGAGVGAGGADGAGGAPVLWPFLWSAVAPLRRSRILASYALVLVAFYLQLIPWANLQQQQDRERHKRRIESKLVHNLTLHGLHGDGSDAHYRCRTGEYVRTPNYNKWGGLLGNREALRPPFNATGIADFHVDISSTDLRIMIVGNSLSEQLSAGLEEAMCYDLEAKLATAGMMDRDQLRNKTNCKSIDVRDPNNELYRKKPMISSDEGGMIMNVITLDLFDTAKMWNLEDPAISSLVKTLEEVAGSKEDPMKPLIDVFIYQFQSGHVNLEEIDDRLLEEVVMAASELFGASMVVFPTVAAMNNVNNVLVWTYANKRIRNFVSNYLPRVNSTVTSVQTIDYARLINEYMIINAALIGIPVNDTFVHRKNDRFRTLTSIACASLPFDNDKGCEPGMISLDGIHLCPQTVHGRINAGLVCLLDCEFNRIHNASCANECNGKFMTMTPVLFPTN